jgi:hypothetical protein
MEKTRNAARLGLFVFAAAAVSHVAAQDKWSAHLDFEGKFGSQRNLGEGDLFVPLLQDSRTLLFGNLRARFDNQDSTEGNAGLGVRRMLDGGVNLGGYGYFDRRRTGNGNDFDQVMLGAEALGRTWDLRGNVYQPTGERVRAVDTASTASVSGASVIVSSVTREERALKGYDAEIGWRTPLFGVEDPSQLRLYAGGYHFKDDLAEVSGPRMRAELTVAEVPGLSRGAEFIMGAELQEDSLRGTQAFLSLRFRVPLGGNKERPRLNWQERRMTAPVVRDVDIVAPVVTRAPVVENATALADGRAFTVINGQTTTGANLNAAVNAAGNDSVVILSGNFDTGASTVSLAFGQTLAGAVEVRTPSGFTATTPRATINATNTSAVQINAGGKVIGMNVSVAFSGATGGSGIIVAGGSANTLVSNSIISIMQSGTNGAVGINFSGAISGTASANVVTVTGSGPAGTLTALGISGGAITVSGNTLGASGGVQNRVVNFSGGTIVAGSTGNVRGSGDCTGAPTAGSIAFTNGTTCP